MSAVKIRMISEKFHVLADSAKISSKSTELGQFQVYFQFLRIFKKSFLFKNVNFIFCLHFWLQVLWPTQTVNMVPTLLPYILWLNGINAMLMELCPQLEVMQFHVIINLSFSRKKKFCIYFRLDISEDDIPKIEFQSLG